MILIERNSNPALVCVSPEMWDALAKYIDELECSVEAVETELAIAVGEQQSERVTSATWTKIERKRDHAALSA